MVGERERMEVEKEKKVSQEKVYLSTHSLSFSLIFSLLLLFCYSPHVFSYRFLSTSLSQLKSTPNSSSSSSLSLSMNTLAIKDCSQGFCSFYCPQWCYIIFPPPPPPPLKDFQSSGPDFSPLVITIIGFLAGALLLLGYYAILSNYCRNTFSSSPPTTSDQNDQDVDVEMGAHEPWFVAADGIDEAVIGSIATFKYRRREGLVEGTDCSVCLSEFVEDERLKLLPKCSHAFHVTCIDTWLHCHSNCPLCRARVAGAAVSPPPPLPSPPVENLELHIRDREVEKVSVNAANGSGDGEGSRRIRRSVSMVDVINREEGDEMELESSRERGEEVGKLSTVK